ncbi:hypothetical protein AVEN_166454-1 [Araneus ventricosus]|uniref:Uncharacterized protein n=1 Tax=Araneus ventricosus TaxID=182803 RepID=A0A4Y2N2K8_ARAVE|nr:hypothetical protein AVEN_166454-1 [Araneus ventricosus]
MDGIGLLHHDSTILERCYELFLEAALQGVKDIIFFHIINWGLEAWRIPVQTERRRGIQGPGSRPCCENIEIAKPQDRRSMSSQWLSCSSWHPLWLTTQLQQEVPHLLDPLLDNLHGMPGNEPIFSRRNEFGLGMVALILLFKDSLCCLKKIFSTS